VHDPQDSNDVSIALNAARRWVKRFGVAGFLFFLIKGLAWLVVPTIIVWASAE